MVTPSRRGTAKIYQFPQRPRASALEAQRCDPNAPSRLAPVADYGSGWYHQAAIQEELRARKP